MSKISTELFRETRQIKALKESLKGQAGISRYISPLPGSSKALFVQSIFKQENSVLLLCQDEASVDEMRAELDVLDLGQYSVALDNLMKEGLQERLTDIGRKKKYIVIAPYEILGLQLPSKQKLNKDSLIIRSGEETDYEGLIEYLEMLGYTKQKFVENLGEYAIRGSILDFWSYSERSPVRLEFDGNFVESLRYFDLETQRSSSLTEEITLAGQILGAEDQNEDIFDYLDNPLLICSLKELTDFRNGAGMSKKDSPIAKSVIPQEEEIDQDLRAELMGPEAPEEKAVPRILNDRADLFEKDARWLIEDEISQHKDRLDLGYMDTPTVNSNLEFLFQYLYEYSLKGFSIVVTAENEMQVSRLSELFRERKQDAALLLESGSLKITVLALKRGFVDRENRLVVFTNYQIFNKPYRTKSVSGFKKKRSLVKDFASLKRGDYVVHEDFGIGMYAGLETINIGQTRQESIKILYDEGGVVYVNLNYLALVKKFSTQGEVPAKLSKLGSNEWKNTKKKVKAKIKDAARDLIGIYARRKASTGYSFSQDTSWQRELEASFFYEATPDQIKVTDQVKEDMESSNPMDRLVCGDVGFGKTEVAVRAAFKAVMDGKQVAVLVPTTILAEQHFDTFRNRLGQFPVKVEVLSRFRTRQQQLDTLSRLEAGGVDIVIGTHRLLSKDVHFKNLGLLIIDEEQKFGVMSKEKLKSLRANVDTLTLTATPIPRTLNLSLLGARDLSIISTPPPNRQPIYTKVEGFEITKIRQWIMDEVKRSGQVYFVHDRVQSIGKLALYLNKYLPEINIAVAHGQMKSSELEKVIYDFMNRRYQVLLTTKIIESGLDIPNVNTIIVNRADRFGLSELHQLRGRVGRSDRKAHAYFIVPSLNTITKKAVRRLQAIEEFSDVGEGFSISMRDLEIRGAGNLLGTEQSGFINNVGFDLYVKLLDEAVQELKENEFSQVFKDLPKAKERTEPTIDAYFEIGIPQDFMPDQADRLSFYTALFSIKTPQELEEVKEELFDKFGRVPQAVGHLIMSAELRFFASIAMFERIVITKKSVSIILPKEDKEEYYKDKFLRLMQYVVDNYSNEIKFKQDGSVMKLTLENKFPEPEGVLKYLLSFTKRIINDIMESNIN